MQDGSEFDILSVSTTVGTVSDAKAIAGELLQRKLAACVQVEAGLQSLYRWDGKLCDEPEVRVVIKTLPGCESALEAIFATHHPYEVPQFLACLMRASAPYARWVRGEVVVPARPIS